MTYRIPAQNIAVLRQRVCDLNKRADKLRVPAIELRDVSSYCIIHIDRSRGGTVYEVEITGAAIGLAGWHFLGSIEHTHAGNILRAAPGQTVPERFRDATNECGHCGTRRSRKNTFVVQHWGSGETMQVGRQCTRDFLGHVDPDRLASLMQHIAELGDEPNDRERDRYRPTYAPVEIVSLSLSAIRTQGGFRPASFEASTSGTVRLALMAHILKVRDQLDEMGFEFPTEAEQAEAVRLVEWVRSSADSSDYMHNLRVAASLDGASDKHIGLLASMPKAAQTDRERQLERERRAAEKAERDANSRPAPEGKIDVVGQVVKLTASENDYGTVDKMIVADDSGFRVYVTVPAAIASVKIGDRVSFTARLTRSDRDVDFAFGKRPSKAVFVEDAA